MPMKPRKYKIIFSNYDDKKNPYYGGGGADAIHEVARRLAREHEVTVITGKYPSYRDEVIDRVYYKRIGTTLVGPKLGQLIYSMYLPFYVLKERFDVWIESFTPPFSTGFLQLFTKKPVIGLVHMLGGEDMKRKYRLPFQRVERIGLKTYRNFIVLSEETKKKIKRMSNAAEIRIIPNGIDLSEIINVQADTKKHILFIGRIEVDQKGLDLLLEGYARFREKAPNGHKLVIAGAGEKKEEQKLKNLIHRLELDGKAIHVGKASGKRKEEAFQKAQFVVVPSRFEAFSIVALETFSFGLPLVAFDIEGLEWIPDECCIKVEPFMKDKLADAMLRLSQNRELRQQLGKTGKSFASKFSWEKIAEKFQVNINEAISK